MRRLAALAAALVLAGCGGHDKPQTRTEVIRSVDTSRTEVRS